MTYKKLKTADLKNKTVLVRGDLNLPLQDGIITDDFRLKSILPTLRYIKEQGGKIVLCSHLGRPKGTAVEALSLRSVAERLASLMPETPISFVPDAIGDARDQALKVQDDGEILFLENLRFHPGEESNDPLFAKALATGIDLYVNDAFACSHRAHASISGVPALVPSYAGLNLEQELEHLERYLKKPKRPLTAIIGGAKISTKLALLDSLIEQVDHLIVGGAMANTLLLAQGYATGRSLVEGDLLEAATLLLEKAALRRIPILLPQDVVVTHKIEKNSPSKVVNIEDVTAQDIIVDAGPKTTAAIAKIIENSKTVIWNGTVGVHEISPFDRGTTEIAQKIAACTKTSGLISIAGGGDTLGALQQANVAGDFTYLSTAGGAFLEWLEGKPLPGIAALSEH